MARHFRDHLTTRNSPGQAVVAGSTPDSRAARDDQPVWLRNSVVLHKRTAYVDWPDPERRRHLLRLWLAARDFDDGDELLRGGIPVR